MCDDFLHTFSYFNHLEIPKVLIVPCPEEYFNVNHSTVVALINFFSLFPVLQNQISSSPILNEHE